jgi:hypothetical protein
MLLSVSIVLRFSKGLSFLRLIPADSLSPSSGRTPKLPPPENEAFASVRQLDSAEQLNAKCILWRLIQFPLSAFIYSRLMDLAIALSRCFLHINCIQWNGFWIPAGASCVHRVIFFQSISDSCVFSGIAVCRTRIRMLLLQPVVESPTHNPHKCGVSEGLPSLEIQLQLVSVAPMKASHRQSL